MTYVNETQAALLRFYRRVDFEPYQQRRESYRLPRRRVTFEPLVSEAAPSPPLAVAGHAPR